MRKAYLAISYANRKQFYKEVKSLQELCNKKKIDLLVFVDTYNFKPTEEKEMMKTAFKEIDSSDFLIAELTTKSIGVGIEIGYAFAKHKPIIYIRRENAEYSTTAAGSSNTILAYKNEFHLMEIMNEIL